MKILTTTRCSSQVNNQVTTDIRLMMSIKELIVGLHQIGLLISREEVGKLITKDPHLSLK